MNPRRVSFRLDGEAFGAEVSGTLMLSELLSRREGCGEGVCGACTVAVDGRPVRSCLMLAVQAEGADVRTAATLAEIEGAAADEEGLTPLQRALGKHRAFQCGWCLQGLLVGTACFLNGRAEVPRGEILAHMVGHLCRCVAGHGVVAAIEDVLAKRREAMP